MSGGVTTSGFETLISAMERSPDQLQRNLIQKAHKLAEQVAGQTRQGAHPGPTGQLRRSVESYVEQNGDQIEFGVKSNYPVFAYFEFGTGPVGSRTGHPMDGELGISRRPDGWTYWSDQVQAQRQGENPDATGYVYTEGVPAEAPMYNAAQASREEILAALGASFEEVIR